MSAATNLKFVFSSICYLSFFTHFVLSDLYRILITDGHEIRSEILDHHSLTKVAKCTFSDGQLNHSEIICESLTIVTADWSVDDTFFRTEFTFHVSDEENINVKHVDFSYKMTGATENRSGSAGPEYDYGNLLQTGRQLVDELDTANLSRDEKHDENEDITFNVGTQNKTMHNKTKKVPTPKLIKLTKLKLQKVYQYPGDNATVTHLETDSIFLLLMASEKFVWDMDFGSSFPVGVLDIDEDCFHKTENSRKCFKGILFLEDAMPGGKHIYQQDLRWYIARHDLWVERCSLTTEYKPKSSISNDTYLRVLLNSTRFTELRITGRDWPDLPPLLSNLSTLTKLDLTGNRIETIPEDIFNSAPNVKELILAKNELKQLPQGISLLRRLKYLDLSENPLQYVYNFQDTFTSVVYDLTELQWLILSNTPLKDLRYLYGYLGPQGTDTHMARTQLLGLDVSLCGITTLDDVFSREIFSEQTSLQSVNLSGNNISAIPAQLFNYLSDIKRLNISSLQLLEGPKLELTTTLESIDLSHNNIRNPGDVLVTGAVISLNLSFNKIEQWHNANFFTCNRFRQAICFNSSEITPDPSVVCNFVKKSVWVKHINLSHNSLTVVSTQMVASLNRLAVVDLGINPFTCNNCTLIEFKKWFLALDNNNVTLTEYVTLGVKRTVTCKEPYSFKGFPVRDVDFNPKFCVRETTNYYWAIEVIIVPTILIMIFIISVLMYAYRYEGTYLCHLVKIMKKRRSNETKTSEDFQFDAFVCYSGSDRSWVISEFLPRMENSQQCFRLCLHERDFVLGSYITHNIVNSMQHSRHTIIVLTNSFVRSQWCRWELEMANHRLFEGGSDFLILLELERLDQTAVPRHLRYLMDTRTYLEWPESGADTSSAWKRLKTRLGKSIYQQERERASQS